MADQFVFLLASSADRTLFQLVTFQRLSVALTRRFSNKPFRSQVQKVHSPNIPREKCISEVVRIGSIISFQLNKLRKAKFSILCDVIFLVRLQGNFEIDHGWE